MTFDDTVVVCEPLAPDHTLPVVIRCACDSVDAVEWFTRHREPLEALLMERGAILFRNFGIGSVEVFRRLVASALSGLMQYRERSSPRTEIADRVYTSTDYPADQAIFPHNEHSYSSTFPSKIAFWCHIPPVAGGETPIGDTRRVHARIDPAVREKFERLGWMYVRNFSESLGMAWQTVFQTSDRAEVEAYCRAAGIRCAWRSDNHLRTTQVRPTTIRHPVTGDRSWFNHVAFFHVTTLPGDVAARLRHDYADEDLPNNTYYGDGSPIEDDVVDEIRRAYRDEMVSFPWQRGDLLFVDNLITAHARQPFTPPRRILVTLANPMTREDQAP